MKSQKGMLHHTFEYDAIGKNDPGFVELRIHFDFTPGTPETARGYMADPAKYDPGSDHEVSYDHAEREYTDAGGDKHWLGVRAGDWLDEHCQAWLASREAVDLFEGLPDDGEPDPDRRR